MAKEEKSRDQQLQLILTVLISEPYLMAIHEKVVKMFGQMTKMTTCLWCINFHPLGTMKACKKCF